MLEHQDFDSSTTKEEFNEKLENTNFINMMTSYKGYLILIRSENNPNHDYVDDEWSPLDEVIPKSEGFHSYYIIRFNQYMIYPGSARIAWRSACRMIDSVDYDDTRYEFEAIARKEINYLPDNVIIHNALNKPDDETWKGELYRRDLNTIFSKYRQSLKEMLLEGNK